MKLKLLVTLALTMIVVAGFASPTISALNASFSTFLPLILSSSGVISSIGGCPLFPANNVWNARVDTLPLEASSAIYINSIGPTTGLHPDFGSGTWDGGPIGIPYNFVSGNQPFVPVSFDYYDESDPGPYPIPSDALIEGGSNSSGDRHVLVVDEGHCKLYEMWSAYPQQDGSWQAGSGAIFDLNSNALRTDGYTSADAAGLPLLPGLVRYDEVASGVITHAVRFTVARTRDEHIWPARHDASSSSDTSRPPMGQRFRLKADYDISGFPLEVRVILTALKTYGMILADNGSNWYISGVPDERWNNDVLVTELRRVKGSDFEAVDESGLMVNPDSGEVKSSQLFSIYGLNNDYPTPMHIVGLFPYANTRIRTEAEGYSVWVIVEKL